MDRQRLLSVGVKPTDVPPRLEPPRPQRARGTPWLGFLASVGLAACGVIALLSAVVEAQYQRAVGRAIANGGLPVDAPTIEHHRHVLSVIAAPIAVATAVVFVVWFHRAYWNLPRLGIVHLRYGTGWAVGAWFVPILNLFRPKGIADDIWRGSDPALPATSPLPVRRVPLTLTLWWATFVSSAVLAGVGAGMEHYATRLTILKAGSSVALAGYAGRALAAFFAVAVVHAITVRQAARVGAFEKGLRQSAAGRLPERQAAQLEAMRTPGGPRCPDCGFENHAMAASCAACHRRL